MTEETPNLALPYIIASQAQKHVTHNEALRRIDAVLGLRIKNTLAAPPASPGEGETYLVDIAASGAWLGKDGKIANFVDGAWQFLSPVHGLQAWFETLGEVLVHDGSDWINPASTGSLGMLGVNAAPDLTNRFALSAAASLFNNAGNGHQIKINKADASDTASILFQTGWSGRAEMGTTGSDAFQLKVSDDGSIWQTALQISGDGVVQTPQRPLVTASLAGSTITPASGDMIGFDTLSISQGGPTLGAALASGFGNGIVVPAPGSYLIALTAKVKALGSFTLEPMINGSVTVAALSSEMATTGFQTFSILSLATLSAGDELALRLTGSAEIMTGAGATELTATML